MTIPQAFDLALQHHQAGRLAEAEPLYRQILAADPRHSDALHLLGVIAHQVGQHVPAIDLIRQAISLAPGNPNYHSNLGEACRAAARLDDAIAAYRRAIALNPDFSEAHNNLGSALTEKGQLDEAIVACRRAIVLNPSFPEAHNSLGNALRDTRQLDDAITAYRQAIALKPDLPEAHSNLGNALRDKGQLDEAIASYRQAIALRPDYPDAHSNLGNALRDKGLSDAAIAAFSQAIALKPNYAGAHSNLGNALRDKGQPDEAIAAFCRAIAIKPDFAEAHSNLGNAFKDTGRLDEAIASYRKAIALKPEATDLDSNLLLALNYQSDFDPAAIAEEHRRWNRLHAEPLRQFILPHPNDRNPDRRLRIGYVSPDFREHPVASFFESLLLSHNPDQAEVFCYANLARADAVTARLQGLVPHWRSVASMTDEQIADLIRKDRIDILVDLAGHTASNRLMVFARKPAPVQVTWLGYPNTTGLKTIDYRLTDAFADPPGITELFNSEHLIRLPRCAWCFRPVEPAPTVTAPPVETGNRITFGCFNAMPKINAPLLRLWSKILHAAPGSRLLLKNAALRRSSAQQDVRNVLEAEGIASDRIELVGHFSELADHLACYGRVDIALDTFPYHGTTTTCEALWMGVPVVSMAGRTHASRVGVSLLSNIGLPELVAQTGEDYVKIAADLASDPSRLLHLRSTLRHRMETSPVMDAPQFARDVEDTYRQMWHQWCVPNGGMQPGKATEDRSLPAG